MFRRLFILLLSTLNLQQERKCQINTRTHFGEPLPVIIRDGSLLEPTDKFGNVEMPNGDGLTISCEGGGHITHPFANHDEVTAYIICDSENRFVNDEWLRGPSEINMFHCSSDSPPHTSRRTNRTCYGLNTITEVGYKVQNVFYPLYETCFDSVMLTPLYSKYTQKPYNANYQTKVNRPYFTDEDYYRSVPVSQLFSPNGLRNAVGALVGHLINQYFAGNETLSRGHLAAKTDFVYAFSERATFHYINCAPQWKSFNGGNWNTLEIDLRNHINAAEYDTIVYTGTYGVTQLFNHYGRRVEIYIHTDENNNPVIPVPQYYYKVVYEPSTKRGIAFVGINNPYYSLTEARELFFCEDICGGNKDFSWLTWHPNNPSEGVSFCCTVPNFRQTVPHLPDFQVTGVLS